MALEGTLRFEDARTFETETQGTTLQKVFIPLVSASSRARAPTVYLETCSTWLGLPPRAAPGAARGNRTGYHDSGPPAPSVGPCAWLSFEDEERARSSR